jgi:hypothetical protein
MNNHYPNTGFQLLRFYNQRPIISVVRENRLTKDKEGISPFILFRSKRHALNLKKELAAHHN